MRSSPSKPYRCGRLWTEEKSTDQSLEEKVGALYTRSIVFRIVFLKGNVEYWVFSVPQI